MTVSMLAGNTDNKLTQQEWSAFIADLTEIIQAYASEVYFKGGPATNEPFQNFCWVFEADSVTSIQIQSRVTVIRVQYQQDSVAWISGTSMFY